MKKRVLFMLLLAFLLSGQIIAQSATTRYSRGLSYLEQAKEMKSTYYIQIMVNPTTDARLDFETVNKLLNQAIGEFTAAIKLDKKFADAYYQRGMAYHEIQNYKKATADVKAALRINPNHSSAKDYLERAKK